MLRSHRGYECVCWTRSNAHIKFSSELQRPTNILQHMAICFLSSGVLMSSLPGLVRINWKFASAVAIPLVNHSFRKTYTSCVISCWWPKDENRRQKTKSGPCSLVFTPSVLIWLDWCSCRSWYVLVTHVHLLSLLRKWKLQLPFLPLNIVATQGHRSPILSCRKHRATETLQPLSSFKLVVFVSFQALGNGCPFSTFSSKNDSFCKGFLTHSVLLWTPSFGLSTFYKQTTREKFF